MLSVTQTILSTMTRQQQIINWKDVKGSYSGLTLRYYPGTGLDGLRKTTKNFSQNSMCSGWDANQAPPAHNSEALPFKPTYKLAN
jgi:hypothetical protein